jgi:hypothetical protein
LVLA